MRVRILRLQSLAATLAVLWAATTVLILAEYRPGGPFDLLVASGPLLATVMAAAAGVWPPVARGRRAGVAIGWIGVAAMLLLIPSLVDLIRELRDPGPGTALVPSAEGAYAWFLAMGATCVFAAFGISRRILGPTAVRGPRLALAVVVAVALTAVGAGVSGMATLADELALRDRAAAASDLGPTDPSLIPPKCAEALVPSTSATIEVEASARADSMTIGTVKLTGTRSNGDASWSATLTGSPKAAPPDVRSLGYVKVGPRAWLRENAGGWAAATTGAGADALDGAIVGSLLPDSARLAAEDLGIELFGAARARHCRLAIGGPAALQAFRPLRWLIGQAPLAEEPALDPWRGELEWWVFGDGELGVARVSIGGSPPGSWPGSAIQGTLTETITARYRGAATSIAPPAP